MNIQTSFSRFFAPLMMFALLLVVSTAELTCANVNAQKPRTISRPKTTSKYVCPMHPEVESKRPGTCHKCNMALVKQSVANVPEAFTQPVSTRPIRIPHTTVFDQDGRQRDFYTDLVKGKTVAINFIFTECAGICPTLSARFLKLQKELGDRIGRDIELISISVDPTTDVPERLHAYRKKFKAGPGWTLVTGSKPEIDDLLRALGSYAVDRNSHTQMFLVGNDAAGYWTRVSGLASTTELVKVINEAATKAPASTTREDSAEASNVMVPVPASTNVSGSTASTAIVPASDKSSPVKSLAETSAAYFPNTVLLTQDNKPVRFYDDLLKGKVVMINFMFATCNGVCPPMMANLAKVQRYLGERVGREVVMISITVDPVTDTTAALKRYANNFKAGPGWYYLTGKKEDIDTVLRKVGGLTPSKFEHSSLVVLGNEATGEWTKAPAMMNASELASVVVQLIGKK